MASRKGKVTMRYSADDFVRDIVMDSDSEMSEISEVEDDSDNDESYVPPAVASRTTSRVVSRARRGVSVNPGGAANTQARRDVAESWERVIGDDHYLSIWCPTYTKRPGPLFPDSLIQSDQHPVHYFSLLFPKSAFELICEQTNAYAMSLFDNPVDVSASSRFGKWVETSVNEMKAYVGLQIFMGLCSKPALADYWSLGSVDKTPGFGDVMSGNRYQLLCSFLHFNDNAEQVPRGQPGYDPLFKIAPLIDILKPLYKVYYIPSRELSIDETMKLFAGRLSFKQFMPNKPIRWGIKLWSLAESKTGYILDWNVYTGKGNKPVDDGLGLGHSVVMKLMDGGFLDCGHHLFTDNFYSSPVLFDALKVRGTGACGTVRPTRRNLPDAIKPKNLKLKKHEDPVFYRMSDSVVCAWHDTARVNFISTIDNTGCTPKEIRSRASTTGYREANKPNVASHYNEYMGGVDIFDQKCANYNYPHRVKKWYMALFHFMKEAALVNAYILYMAHHPTSKMNAAEF